MSRISLRKSYHHLTAYLTINNLVIAFALLLAVSWAWGSIQTMQRSFALQKTIELKSREKRLNELQVEKLAYEKRYHESSEYQELAARMYLGLADPGEKVLILPPTREVSAGNRTAANTPTAKRSVPPSNVNQWLSFLLGASRAQLRGE